MSHHIRYLEDMLSLQLFHRKGKSVQLTKQREIFWEYAKSR
ncbi:LysR family transcriptional regulator [Bacillus sp. 37MA]